MAKKLQPRYALFCDEAGGPADEWRSLAVVSGSLAAMLDLEYDLRQALALSGVHELKWAKLRKRPAVFRSAALALELATAAAQNGSLRFQLWCWEAKRQPKAWTRLSEPQRMQEAYRVLLPRSVKLWRKGRWLLMPDDRTGVRWKDLQGSLTGAWRGAKAKISGLYPVDSKRWALIQCCDLLAGMQRHSLHSHVIATGPGAIARGNRDSLMQTLLEMSQKRRLGLKAAPVLLGNGKKFSAQRVLRWT
jgi:hypothetical protein